MFRAELDYAPEDLNTSNLFGGRIDQCNRYESSKRCLFPCCVSGVERWMTEMSMVAD